MGENICKRWDQQGINFQNVQAANTTQYKKKKNNTIKKWAEDLDISPKKKYRWPTGT